MKNLEQIKGLDELPATLTEDWIEQAMAKLDKSQMTPDQRFQYEKMMAQNGTIIQYNIEEKELLVKEAEKRGEKRGEKKWKKEGEKNKALEAAKKLKNLGIEMEIIIEVTGLNGDEIEKL